MQRRAVIVALTVLLAVCGAWAQDDERVLLRYQWNAGEDLVWEVTAETTGTVITRDLTKDPVEETIVPVWTRMLMPITLSVESVDGEGNGTIVYKLGQMQMDVQAEGRQMYMVFDPETGTMTVDGEEVPMPEGMDAMMATTFRMVISPRGELVEMELPEGLEALMAGMGGNMMQWMRMSQQWSATFPEEPVGVDHVWSAGPDESLAGLAAGPDGAAAPGMSGSILYHMTGTRTVANADCVAIDMLGAMEIASLPTPAGMMGGMGGEDFEFTMGPMHLSMVGGYDFDAAAGKLVGGDIRIVMDMVQRMKGTMQTPEGPQEMNMEVISRGMTVDTTIEAR